tara:strand:- start:810 stop:1148 length:339 start_codon:yes stop_codon:yes gene_type:complete
MVGIGDIVKSEPVFPDSESVKSESLVGKELSIKAMSEREGDKGQFLIVLATVEGKEISFSCGGVAVVGKLRQVKDHFKLEADDSGVFTFPETVEVTFVERKSQGGRNYYDLE